MNRLFVESLEPRTLFAGVTLLATGRNGPDNTWMQTMANDLTTRIGGLVPQFILSLNANAVGTLIPSITQVAGTGTPQTSSSGEIIVLLNYYSISTNVSYPSEVIGTVFANYLMSTPVDGILLASLPIHEIGLSRGCGILDQMNNTLGQAGIWVDQETELDPDPLAAQGDPPSTIYDNVAFVDDYWRNDGTNSSVGEGQPVDGAYNLNVYWLDSEDAGYTSAHEAPTGYYDGTINLTGTEGGDGPIYSEWYGDTPTMPARDATGFIYTDLVGAARPLSGVWAASGGTGARTAAGQVGTQWGNATDLTITSGNTISTGNSIQVSYLHEDRGSADTITFYLDTDRNPYNNTFADTLGSVNLPETGIITKASATLSTAGVAPGTYWLCAKITDAAGNTRYTYESITAPLTVTSNTVVNGSLTGSQATAASGYNLTTLGTSDWAHWGTGEVYGAFDHKATGGSQISNVTTLGSGNYGQSHNASRDVSWTDGTPLASDSGDDAYIFANSALGAGYSFTVPADTTTRTLYVYAGGYSDEMTLTAQLSDTSASNYVATASGSGLYTNLYTITYHAASAGQILTVSLVNTSDVNGVNGAVELIAAALAGAPVADTTPPTAKVTSAPTLTAATSAAYQFTVTYSDNVAVNASTLGNSNLVVTGSGYSQEATLVSTGLANGPTVVATYSVPAPGGEWSNSSDGSYTIALESNQVADTSGNFALPVSSLDTFSVNIPVPGAGSLVGSQAAAAASYNLTTLGTSDWAHWGTGEVYGAFDHKATGGSQISNVTTIGSGVYGQSHNASRNVTWTDGTPLASDSGDDAYIFANSALGAGFSFTVPADTTTRTLYVYAGGYSDEMTLTAHLSDGSAADYVATASGSGLYTNLYTITYKAASAGQTLKISLVNTNDVNGVNGAVELIAAALVG